MYQLLTLNHEYQNVYERYRGERVVAGFKVLPLHGMGKMAVDPELCNDYLLFFYSERITFKRRSKLVILTVF